MIIQFDQLIGNTKAEPPIRATISVGDRRVERGQFRVNE